MEFVFKLVWDDVDGDFVVGVIVDVGELFGNDGWCLWVGEDGGDDFEFFGVVEEGLGEGDGFVLFWGVVEGCEVDLGEGVFEVVLFGGVGVG